MRSKTKILGCVVAMLGFAAWSGCGDDSSTDASATAPSGGTGATGPGGTGGGTGGSTSSIISTASGPSCTNLECKQVQCEDVSVTTTVSGTVYDPAGKTPLYNVVVYVPNTELDALPEGSSCDQCGATLSGDPVVTALTDEAGNFVLENVPVGDNIPLVIQVGKWRRAFEIETVSECVDNPTIDTSIRLARNQTEGDIPKIALTTGGADPLECWLRKIGLDDSEFTNPDGTGRVNLFRGYNGTGSYDGGADFLPAESLWSDVDQLRQYDLVLTACEGTPDAGNKSDEALLAMAEYTALGGRVFMSHWHEVWLTDGPGDFPNTATFEPQEDLENPFTAHIDTSFPKGQALSTWLVNVEASQTEGELEIVEGQHTVDAVNPAISTRWIYGEDPTSVQYLTFNTPIGVAEEEQCGRVVLSDIHVSSGDDVDEAFPSGCETTELSPQEKALLFMLFDLSACIVPDDDIPIPPPS